MTNSDLTQLRDRFIRETEQGIAELLAALEASMEAAPQEPHQGRTGEPLRAVRARTSHASS